MKGKGTPKRRILFLRFTDLSGRTFLNVEPSELNTLIQYTHNVCSRTAWMLNACGGKITKYMLEQKEKMCFLRKLDSFF